MGSFYPMHNTRQFYRPPFLVQMLALPFILLACKAKEAVIVTPPEVVTAIANDPFPNAPDSVSLAPTDSVLQPPTAPAIAATETKPPEPCPEAKERPAKPRKKPVVAVSTKQQRPPHEAPKTALAGAIEAEEEWNGRPIRAEELAPLIIALYLEADSLSGNSPDSALARINFALRYCNDGAFYALSAKMACHRKDFYSCFVLSERATTKQSNLSSDTHEVAMRLQIASMQEMRRESPSSELDAQINRISSAYQLRYQHPAGRP
jgi:hypothetical protein